MVLLVADNQKEINTKMPVSLTRHIYDINDIVSKFSTVVCRQIISSWFYDDELWVKFLGQLSHLLHI